MLIARTLLRTEIIKSVPELLNLAELRAGNDCDNLSVVAMTWAESNPAAISAEVSTQTLELEGVSTQFEDFGSAERADLTDEEIERAIEEIREAIRKHSMRKP